MLNPDYRDILSAFNDAKVKYLVVGAYALAAHGHPRATGDIDLWIEKSAQNAECVMQALDQFGAPTSDISIDDFQQPDLVFQIGVTPRRIDILTSIDGVDFRDAWPEKLDVEVDDVQVPVISKMHLIENKRAMGRDQDMVDIELLEDADPDKGNRA